MEGYHRSALYMFPEECIDHEDRDAGDWNIFAEGILG
jgi:hypothetical protein